MSDQQPPRERPATGQRPDLPEEPAPDFGPSGYLPGRAARRARKIVLRAPLGAQWIVASVLAGIVVLVAGLVFLATRDDPPAEPFVEVGPVDSIGDATYLDDHDALLVGAGGRIRVFADAGDLGLEYCAPSRQIEGEGGRVWTLTGRGLGGADSLREHPTTVHDGVVYVDPTTTIPGPSPRDEPADPVCNN